MNKAEKQETIESFGKLFTEMKGSVLADFRGLNVLKVTKLRADLRKEKIGYKVVKNTLARQACMGTKSEVLKDKFVGPIAMVYTLGDPVQLAKFINDYAKKEDKFAIKVGCVEGRLLDPDQLKVLATMPPREVMLARVLGTLNAPIGGLVNVLAGTIRSFVQVLGAIEKKKGGTAE
ncbi:MAG: 50S ribosomal protein L10 [Deltaproteobacteria bacterium RIFOXYA12_FULL_61_11]|nr:MAG: 50S ribosomal protein L10 [Deltaproteobacteria bacterium RIFOXYA12_FULL_61_11]